MTDETKPGAVQGPGHVPAVTVEDLIAQHCYVAGIGDGYQVSGIEQAATAIRALLNRLDTVAHPVSQTSQTSEGEK